MRNPAKTQFPKIDCLLNMSIHLTNNETRSQQFHLRDQIFRITTHFEADTKVSLTLKKYVTTSYFAESTGGTFRNEIAHIITFEQSP